MYPADPDIAYLADNAVDFCADLAGKFYPGLIFRDFGQEKQDEYVKNLEHFVGYLGKILAEHSKKFIAADEMTIGDCAIAALIFTYVLNDNLAAGATFRDKGRAVISANYHFD